MVLIMIQGMIIQGRQITSDKIGLIRDSTSRTGPIT